MSKRFRHWSIGIGMLAVFVGLLLPSLAWAQNTPAFGHVDDTDLSKRIFIDYLFGPLVGTGTSPLTSVVSILNSAILFLGGIFAAYTIIAGTMATAHDGQMLGQKWSSLWIPIRTTLGAAAVMPTIGGGWCAAQAVVVWLAMMGISIANAMWSGYSANPLTDAVYSPPSMALQVHDVFGNMLMNNVCVAAYKQSFSDQNSASLLSSDAQTFGVYPDHFNFSSGSGYSYGTETQSYLNTATCGKVDFSTVDTTVDTSGAQDQGSTADGNYVSMAGSSLLNMPELASSVLPTQQAQIQAAQSTLASLAQKIVNNTATQAEVSSTLDQVTSNYVTAMHQAAVTAYASASNQNFKDQMSKDGWVTAGAFYMSIARAQDQLTNLVNNLPTATSSWTSNLQVNKNDTSHWWTNVADWARDKFSGVGSPTELVKDSMARAWVMVKTSQKASAGGVQFATDESGDSASGSSLMNKVLGGFTSGMGGITNVLKAGSGYDQNPIIMAKNLGNTMINISFAALAVSLIAGAFTVGGAGVGTFTMLAGPFSMLFGTLLVAGASMTYYLPILPFILWIGVVLGWAVLLIEAVIAAPLWAVVHMAPDADGVVGRGGQGYMLVLSLTLRPALMIVGLIAAISLMHPIGYLINSTFAGAFLLAQGPGWSGVTATIAGCAIYAGVMISVINRVFGLIHVIPDRLLRWIGGGGNELGSEAEAVNQGSAGKMIAATQATQQLTNAANDMVGKMAQNRAANLGRDAADRGAQQQRLANLNDSVARKEGQSSRANDRAVNDSTGNSDFNAQNEGRALMATALGSALEQARYTVSQKGRGPDGKKTEASMAQYAAAQDFVQSYDEASQSGQPGWEEGFINDQVAKYANEANPDTRPSFANNVVTAQRGLQQSKTNYREQRAQNIQDAKTKFNQNSAPVEPQQTPNSGEDFGVD